MSGSWRVISWVGGVIVVAAGTILLMGSLRTSGTEAVHLQQARLETLARSWESHLESTRLAFHDQLVRQDLLAALEHPEDWAEWRMQSKFSEFQKSWTKENGILRGFAVFTSDELLHSAAGDTSGLASAAPFFLNSVSDIALFTPRGQHSPLVVMKYQPVALDERSHPAAVFVFLDPAPLFSPEKDPPASWSLLATPDGTLMSSTPAPSKFSVSKASWPLFLSEGTGTLKQPDGISLCFVRLHIPGMEPLLLVEPVQVRTTTSALLLFGLLILGAGTLVAASLKRTPKNDIPAASITEPIADRTTSDSSGFRQIFQALEDPLCVVDATGHVNRANRSAQDWLRLSKGRPDGSIVVQLVYGELPLTEFLIKAFEDPAAASGFCRFVSPESTAEGTVHATRLSRDEEGHGPVLLHFHPQDVQTHGVPQPQAAETAPAGHDSHCPFPVLSVTAAGLITSFNDAARGTCPRLEDTPLLSEVLGGVESRDIPPLLASEGGTTFESLFGSNAHEFEIVHAEGHILLYAHKLSASKKLEVELKQAQESFYTLCALSPAPVLLVDPRDHAILEANAAAADLFGFTPVDLRGQALDSLTAEPWNAAAGEDLYVAASTSGNSTRCLYRYELIKIEGMPTLLVVLEPLSALISPTEMTDELAAVPAEDVSPAVEAEPAMALGPCMLITLNPTVREVARRLLEKLGHLSEAFTNLDDATVWLIRHGLRPEFVAIDLTDFDEAENWIGDLRARCAGVPCIAITDGGSYDLPGGGPNELLAKPFDLDSLTAALTHLHLEATPCETA